MKKSLLGLALSLLISLPVLAALKVGDMAPDFSAPGSLAGKEFNFSLQTALKKGAVVAVARKLAVLLHKLWVSGEVYEPLRNNHKVVSAVA